MNWKGTCYLLSATVGLFAFIWFFERHIGREEVAPVVGPLAPALDPDAISAIEIVTGEATNRVELVNGAWRLVAPIEYPGEQLFIESFIKLCAELKPHSTVSEKITETQPDGIDDYGFNPPRARVAFTQPSGEVVIEVGRRSPSEKWVYARTKDTKGVEIVTAEILKYIPTSADGWRDRSLVEFNDAPFNRLSIQTGASDFEFTRAEQSSAWRITRPKPAKRADNYRVNIFMRYILDWRIAAFVTDDPKADLEAFGLKTPAAKIVFAQGTNEVASVQLGRSPTNNADVVYARRMSHTNVVLVPKQLLDAVNTPFTIFRDRQLLSFDPQELRQIDVKADEMFTLQRQTNNAWNIVKPVVMPADNGLVGRFMTNLLTLQVVTNGGWVKDVVADYAPFGLAPPRRSYAIHTNAPVSTNQPFAQVGIGSRPRGTLDSVYARRVSEDSVYKISLGEVSRLPLRAFELRDRQVWDFDPRAVTAISVTEAGREWNLVRKRSAAGGDPFWTLSEGSQGVIQTVAIDAQALALSQIRAEKWVYQGEDEQRLGLLGLFDLSHTINLKLGGGASAGTRQIRFGKRSAGGVGVYAAVKLEGGTTVFEYPYEDYLTIRQFLSVPEN